MKVQLIKPLETGKRYETCMSCSLFEVKNSKKFEFYFKALRNVTYPSLNSKTFLRLYVDESVIIKPSFQKWIMDNKPNLEVYKYEDKRFLLKDEIHHDGTFGTMARFLPFFDDSLDVDFIWITDVDMFLHQLSYKIINEMKKEKVQISYTSGCYLREYIPEDSEYPVFAGTIIISKDVKISKYGYDKFLTNVYEKKYKDLKDIIQGTRVAKAHEQDETKFFIYGFDELYINTIAYKDFKKYSILVKYNIGLARFKWYHKDSELISKLFFDNLTEGNSVKNFSKLLKLYEEILQGPEVYKNEKHHKCINLFNKYKEIAIENKNFNVNIIIEPEK